MGKALWRKFEVCASAKLGILAPVFASVVMKNERTAMTKTRLFAALSCSFCLISCGSSSTSNSIEASAMTSDASATTNDNDASATTNDGCPNLAGVYSLTTEIVSTTCKLGLHVITEATYTFTQTAPSCNFTMANTVYPSAKYTGHFAMSGSQAKVIWDLIDPAPSAAGYALTYTAVNLVITPGATVAASTIIGSFAWHSAANCDGATNVCNGAVPAGCLTPQ
jgi:hypothetical protein